MDMSMSKKAFFVLYRDHLCAYPRTFIVVLWKMGVPLHAFRGAPPLELHAHTSPSSDILVHLELK